MAFAVYFDIRVVLLGQYEGRRLCVEEAGVFEPSRLWL